MKSEINGLRFFILNENQRANEEVSRRLLKTVF